MNEAGRGRVVSDRTFETGMFAAVIAALMAASPAFADSSDQCEITVTETATVADIVDSDTIALSDGRRVRLAGIMAPKSSDPATAMLVERARETLGTLVRGRMVTLAIEAPEPDRYGRLVAQVFIKDGGLWVEGELLRRGLARVFTLRDRRSCGRALIAAESEAINAAKGLWADPDFAILQANDSSLLGKKDLYGIVEGRVLSLGRTERRIYLDFGRNWATDFTVTIEASDTDLFETNGVSLGSISGKRVRVRGWLTEWNGPTMRIDHPEQLELLDR